MLWAAMRWAASRVSVLMMAGTATSIHSSLGLGICRLVGPVGRADGTFLWRYQNALPM